MKSDYCPYWYLNDSYIINSIRYPSPAPSDGRHRLATLFSDFVSLDALQQNDSFLTPLDSREADPR
jgi:hypothetical protein